MFERDSACILSLQPLFNIQKIATQSLLVFVNINLLIFILTHDMYTFPVKSWFMNSVVVLNTAGFSAAVFADFYILQLRK